jgi:pyruvate formate lyase activating enzyme
MPGTKIFSIATTGCNWICAYCQNFDISQRRKVEGLEVTPEMVVEHALRYGSHGIAYTYNEPTIFMEFARDVGAEARRRGLFNIFVTNGYWTPEAVKMAGTFLDAATVDFKGNGERNFVRKYVGIPDAEPIYQTLLEIRDKTKIHIEITDLVVPEIGDNLEEGRRLVRWVHDNLGPDTPIHFLRFHPDYKLMHLPWTPVETLEAHYRMAREEGMRYVYIGNVPGHPYEHTYCPGCGGVVVRRYGFDIVEWRLGKGNRCPDCGYKVAIVGSPPRDSLKRPRFIPVRWELS